MLSCADLHRRGARASHVDARDRRRGGSDHAAGQLPPALRCAGRGATRSRASLRSRRGCRPCRVPGAARRDRAAASWSADAEEACRAATASGASYSVPPVVRAIKVLRHIAAGNPVANQAQAARAIGINRTTLLRLLHTLEAEGLIESQPDSGNFVLGAGVLELAGRKISSLDVAQVASPVLARLAARLGPVVPSRRARRPRGALRRAPGAERAAGQQRAGRHAAARARGDDGARDPRASAAPTRWRSASRGRKLPASTPKTATTLGRAGTPARARSHCRLSRQPLLLRARHRCDRRADLRSHRQGDRRHQRIRAPSAPSRRTRIAATRSPDALMEAAREICRHMGQHERAPTRRFSKARRQRMHTAI